jgi:hypothetical protein
VGGSNFFAGTDGGVFISTNSGTTWTAINSGLPVGVSARALMVSGGNLFAGIYDFGIYRRPVSEVTGAINQNPRPEMPDFNIHFALHADRRVTIEFSLPHSDQVTLEIYNLSGRKIATPVDRNFSSGAHIITWNSQNSSTGCYVVKMKAGLNAFVKSIPFFR